MVQSNFQKGIGFVLKWEGGYINDPRDPGKESNFGISKKAYPDLDIKSLAVEEAKEIYYSDYWLKAGCDYLPRPLDLVVLDTAANCGVSQALDFLRISHRPIDYLFLRLKFYADLKRPEFMRGWVLRVVDLWNAIKGEI